MEPVDEKTYPYLLHLVNTYDKRYLYGFVKHSQFFFSSKQVPMLGRYKANNKLTILADPDIFKKCYPYLDEVKKSVSKHYRDITGTVISEADVHPLAKFSSPNEPNFISQQQSFEPCTPINLGEILTLKSIQVEFPILPDSPELYAMKTYCP